MRIAAIEIKNFRAFKGSPLKIKLGKNLLVYGENGSGKWPDSKERLFFRENE